MDCVQSPAVFIRQEAIFQNSTLYEVPGTLVAYVYRINALDWEAESTGKKSMDLNWTQVWILISVA